jgi:hypothetical protein
MRNDPSMMHRILRRLFQEDDRPWPACDWVKSAMVANRPATNAHLLEDFTIPQ